MSRRDDFDTVAGARAEQFSECVCPGTVFIVMHCPCGISIGREGCINAPDLLQNVLARHARGLSAVGPGFLCTQALNAQ